jgi:DNA-binding transcriptional MerR regulator
MRLVAERTGLSPDVLRAWERRYGVVIPGRSEGGQRLYSDADLDRLTLIVKAIEAGRSVGQTSSLSIEHLRRLVAEDAERGAERPTPAAQFQEQALAAVADLAPDRLQAVLRSALLSLGVPGFLEEVVAPLLHQVGDRWHAGTLGIAHEHAASAVVGGMLGWLVDSLEAPRGAPGAVITCLAGERHELGAALARAAAVHAGWRVAYLGPDLPGGDIAQAAISQEAVIVGVSVVAPEDATRTRAELQMVRRDLPAGIALLAGGAGVPSLGPLGDGMTMVRDLAHWRTLLHLHAPVN